jgi:hypothetical protein
MSGRRITAVVLFGVVLAACGAGAAPAPSIVQPVSPRVATTPAVATPAATFAADRPSAPSPTPTARSTPKPTPLPVPPKPTGVKLEEEIEAICGDDPREMCAIGDSTYTLSWKAPRTKGVEIRVYGVTTCFGADSSGTMIDGHCLREHTALPSSVRVLLAKAPASKGKVTWRMSPGAGFAETLDGVPVHSLVVATYNAEGGHSTFAVADAGDYCSIADVACPVGPD